MAHIKQTGIFKNKSRIQIAVLTLACAVQIHAQPRTIDTAKSTMTVHVYKAGVLSAFGHDHEISAPIARGAVDVAGKKVELQVDAGALKVQDPKASEKDRNEVQTTMLGPEVLDAAGHKEIRFQSTGAQEAGAGAWKVTGNLTLHGETRPVSLEVHEKEGRYAGMCRLKISDFGIKPVKAAGGAVSVKDEVQIDFEILLAR